MQAARACARLGSFAVGLASLLVLVVPAAASPPPGATAQCRDGTYSYARHRSGTCSHHGGVAVWLGGATSSSARAVDVGTTVLLAARTRTSRCTLGAEPDRRCSPGAYYAKLTRAVLCSAGFRTNSIRSVSESEKHDVEIEYGLAPQAYGSRLEIDHIVSLELGGSNDIANLFPERADASPGYHVKDRLENRLHELVCAGRIGLRSAQERIAADWESLYRDVFGRAPTG